MLLNIGLKLSMDVFQCRFEGRGGGRGKGGGGEGQRWGQERQVYFLSPILREVLKKNAYRSIINCHNTSDGLTIEHPIIY